MRVGVVAVALAAFIAAAVAQAKRAAEITLTASTQLTRSYERMTLSGTVAGAPAGELVTIQGKECGVPGAFFRALAGTQTAEGGRYSAETWLRTTTTFRAVWKDSTSAPVVVRSRIAVYVYQRARNRFDISVGGIVGDYRGKRVTVQRFDRRVGAWATVKVVVLQKTTSGSSYTNGVRLDVPKGTMIRATFPDASSGPCYAGGTSRLLTVE